MRGVGFAIVGFTIGLVAASAQLTVPTRGATGPAKASCTANVTSNTTLRASLLLLNARGCTNKTLVLQAGHVYTGPNNTDMNLTSGAVEIVGNRATIDANWLGRHFIISGTAYLKLSNLKLRHGHAMSPIGVNREACGGSVALTDTASFSASHVAFEANLVGQHDNIAARLANGGGAVCATRLITSGLKFEDCNFTNNNATANRDGSHTGVGGAVYFSYVRGPIRMSGCRFLGNSASPPTDGTSYPSYGGAMLVENTTFMEFIACLWQHNVAYGNTLAAGIGSNSQGGAINMILGKIQSPDDMFDATVRFKGCTFVENQVLPGAGGADGPIGGAVKFEDYSPVFEDCVFERNEAVNGQAYSRSEPSSGGAVGLAISYNISMTFIRCQFLGNTAGWGGAIVADLTERASNYAKSTFASLEIYTSTFAQNMAMVGGALYLQDIPTQLDECTLAGNVALSDDSSWSVLPVGGAIAYTAGGLYGPLRSLPFLGVNRSRFVANRAVTLLKHDSFYASGGAMHMSAQIDLPVVIMGSSFEGNAVQGGQGCQALQGGGGGALAMATSADGNIDMRLEGTKLLNNNVDHSDLGGALMVLSNSSSVRMKESTSATCAVIDNAVVNDTLCDAEPNGYSGDGSLGGQLFVSSPHTHIEVTCDVSLACEHALDCSQCLINETCAWATDEGVCTSDVDVGSRECPAPPPPWWRLRWVQGLLGAGGVLLLCTVISIVTVGRRWRQELAWHKERKVWLSQVLSQEFPDQEVLITAVSQHGAPSDQIFSEAEDIRLQFGAKRAGEAVSKDVSAAGVSSELKSRRFWFFVGHGTSHLDEYVPAFSDTVSKTSIVDMIRTEVIYGRLELVVLNACHTFDLGEELRHHAFVPCVVCWSSKVDDEAAAVFGKAFAESLAGESASTSVKRVKQAFDRAKVAVRNVTENGVQKFYFLGEGKDARIAAGEPHLLIPRRQLDSDVREPASGYIESKVEQTALEALLSRRQSRPLFVTGPARVGKSELARWLAANARVQTAFSQGIFALRFDEWRSELPLVSSCRVQESLTSTWERLANLLDVPAPPCAGNLREKPEQVKGRRILLILDGVWDEEQVRSFTDLGSETFAVLVTTRLPRNTCADFGEWLEIDRPCHAQQPVHDAPVLMPLPASPTGYAPMGNVFHNRPTRGMNDNVSGDDDSSDAQCFVTGPRSVQQDATAFKLQVWVMIDKYVAEFRRNIERQQDNEEHSGAFAEIDHNVEELSIHVKVEGCTVEPETRPVRWNRRRTNTSSHIVRIPSTFASGSFECTVEIDDPRDRPIFEDTFQIPRASGEAASSALLTEGLLAAIQTFSALAPVKQRSNDQRSDRRSSEGSETDLQYDMDAKPPSPVREHSETARPTLAVGALRASGSPVMFVGSAILWDVPTGLCTTAAHVLLDCAHEPGALDPKMSGVAIGVGSADAPVRWLYTAQVVSVSYPPRLKPGWPATIDAWRDIPVAPSQLSCLDFAVLRVQDYLGSGPSKPLAESFADNQLKALPFGDSDGAQPGSDIRIYGFGKSSYDRSGLAMLTPGIIGSKSPEMIAVTATMLAGHSGGMLLNASGTVIGWCVESQMDLAAASDSVQVNVPSGVHNVRPIKLLRPALEAALAAKPGGSLEEKLEGAVRLRMPSAKRS